MYISQKKNVVFQKSGELIQLMGIHIHGNPNLVVINY